MKIFLDTCMYLSYRFNNNPVYKIIIDDLKNSSKKEQIVLLSVEQEFYKLHYNLSTRVIFKAVKLVRINDKNDFWKKLDEFKNEKNGEIFEFLRKKYGDELFTNRITLLYKRFQAVCKILHQDFYVNTIDCERYDNDENIVKDEINWIKANFIDFLDSNNKNDAIHLAGAIKYNHPNKLFLSDDWIFKKFENKSDYQEEINKKNLEILTPNSYSRLHLSAMI